MSLVVLIASGAAFVAMAVLLWATPHVVQKFSDPYDYAYGHSTKGVDFMVKLKIGLPIAGLAMIISFIVLVAT